MARTTDGPAPLSLLLCALLGTLSTTGAGAQSLPLARADGTGGYQLWTATPGAGAQQLATGVKFQPLSLAGASYRDQLRMDLPVLAGAASPAPHIRLPGGGSLFLVSVAGGASLVHVDADGSLAAAYATTAGGGNGLLGSIAVSADGSSALVALTLAAGGDVVRLDLPHTGGSPAAPLVLTAAQAPLSVDATSLRVSSGRAFFVAGGTLYRADLTSGSPSVAPVALGLPAGDVVLPETVLSADGRSLVLVSQAPSGLRQVHAVTPNGIVQQLTDAPGAIDTASLQSPLGPLLAIAADGTQAAWRATVAGSKEVFLKGVPQPALPPPPPPVQLTADNFFIDTLDNAGILGFAPGAAGFGVRLLFAAGETGGGGALGAGDLFVATLGGGGALALQNATQTSGLSVPPFIIPGELEVTAAVLDPAGERLLLTVDPQGGDAALFLAPADGSDPGAMLLPPFDATPKLFRAGGSVLLLSVPAAAPQLGTELHLLRPVGAPGAPLVSLGTAPTGLVLDRVTDSADGVRAALVASAGPASPSLQLPLRLDIASGALIPAWGQLFQVSPLLALPPSGELLAGVGDPGGPYLFAAFTAFNAGSVLEVPVGFGFPLPF